MCAEEYKEAEGFSEDVIREAARVFRSREPFGKSPLPFEKTSGRGARKR